MENPIEDNQSLADAVYEQVRGMIWFQIETAATNAKCCKVYRDKVSKWNRWCDFIMLVIPTVGFLWGYFSKEFSVPLVSTFLSAIAGSVKQIIPSLKRSDQDLIELDNTAIFYEIYLTKCAHLYSSLYANEISPQLARDRLYPLEIKAAQQSTTLNRLVWNVSGIAKKVKKQATEAVARRFGLTPPSNQ